MPESVGSPGTPQSVSLSFGTWRQPAVSQGTRVETEVVPETDGTSDGILTVEVDHDGDGTVDRSYEARVVSGLSAGATDPAFFNIYVPPGGQYRVVNTQDPNLGNTIASAYEVTE